MLRTALGLVCLLTALNNSLAQDEDANRVLARCSAIRPDADELAMYRLDWAESVDEALQRAEREGRPIFLVIIHAKYGDICSGHC